MKIVIYLNILFRTCMSLLNTKEDILKDAVKQVVASSNLTT